jgi:hypothetical protein
MKKKINFNTKLDSKIEQLILYLLTTCDSEKVVKIDIDGCKEYLHLSKDNNEGIIFFKESENSIKECFNYTISHKNNVKTIDVSVVSAILITDVSWKDIIKISHHN